MEVTSQVLVEMSLEREGRHLREALPFLTSGNLDRSLFSMHWCDGLDIGHVTNRKLVIDVRHMLLSIFYTSFGLEVYHQVAAKPKDV